MGEGRESFEVGAVGAEQREVLGIRESSGSTDARSSAERAARSPDARTALPAFAPTRSRSSDQSP
ncbi:hypothetical protein VD659_09885 [Herbiconiux sp. 11R-BC]|uniref:hypothetical protein n=1 Tax=Herbiconiux sp. 11R-BC TaxID=3111637 RepID=UPI003C0290AD